MSNAHRFIKNDCTHSFWSSDWGDVHITFLMLREFMSRIRDQELLNLAPNCIANFIKLRLHLVQFWQISWGIEYHTIETNLGFGFGWVQAIEWDICIKFPEICSSSDWISGQMELDFAIFYRFSIFLSISILE